MVKYALDFPREPASAKVKGRMPAPRRAGTYPARRLDCRCAVEDALIAIIDCAEAAGWNTVEITDAIIEIADNIALQETSPVGVRLLLDNVRRQAGK